jgi:hypothetical protein
VVGHVDEQLTPLLGVESAVAEGLLAGPAHAGRQTDGSPGGRSPLGFDRRCNRRPLTANPVDPVSCDEPQLALAHRKQDLVRVPRDDDGEEGAAGSLGRSLEVAIATGDPEGHRIAPPPLSGAVSRVADARAAPPRAGFELQREVKLRPALILGDVPQVQLEIGVLPRDPFERRNTRAPDGFAQGGQRLRRMDAERGQDAADRDRRSPPHSTTL